MQNGGDVSTARLRATTLDTFLKLKKLSIIIIGVHYYREE